MATMMVEMATRDPANAQRFVTEMVEITTVRVNVRCVVTNSGGRIMTDVALPTPVRFRPNEVKTVEISEGYATRIRRHEEPNWAITSDPPTPALDDEQEARP
jgi:predicted secreted Zn-dependent protease